MQDPKNATNIKSLKGGPFYRLRVADYRIIYELNNNELTIFVIDINHRKNSY